MSGGDERKDTTNYRLKRTSFGNRPVSIVMQNKNGPCPLLAICNVLLLQGKLAIHADRASIPEDELISLVANYLLTLSQKTKISKAMLANFEHNVSDAITMLPQLRIGLDVNIRFSGIAAFEFTQQCAIFDLLGIPLVHGWLVDPQATQLAFITSLSYNQLVEKIISNTDPIQASLAEQFLSQTSHQLTYFGLGELHQKILPGQFAVFFRNNHFSTLYKHGEELFLLATDIGFLFQERIVWEKLCQIDGDSIFADEWFRTQAQGSPPPPRRDHLEEDFQLALKLDQRERQRAERSRESSAEEERKQKLKGSWDSDCVVS